jgi:serine/threonine-protein kinase
MTLSAAERAGQLLDRKYRIVRLLGEGGMGSVYEARHELIGRRVAIKFLHPALTLHSEMLMRFRREAQAAGKLESENIAAVTDFGESEDGAPYIVMEFLAGEDLSRLLQRSGPLPVSRVVDLLLQACRGLAAAHDQGIVHRDLKPENLFVVRHGDGSDLIKVLDFGIAKLQLPDAASSTRTGATMGTPYYMPREQARGQKDLDARADVYALGVIMYELLSGQKPFLGDGYNEILFRILTTIAPPLGTLRPDLPPELVALVEHAMAPEPAERISSVRELSAGLCRLVPPRDSQPAVGAPVRVAFDPSTSPAPGMTATGGRITVPGASATVPSPSPSASRSPWLSIALVLSLVGIGVVGAIWRLRHEPPPVSAASEAAAQQPPQVAPPVVSSAPPLVSPAEAEPATRRSIKPLAAASIRQETKAPLPRGASLARPHHAAIDPYAP